MSVTPSALSPRARRIRVAVVFVILMAIICLLSGLVAEAITTLTRTADAIDDKRSLKAAAAAQTSLRKQIGATIRDNAYWDDAYRKIAIEGDAQWAAQTWGIASRDYPLYDTALVIGPDNAPLIAYHNGEPIRESLAEFFDGSLFTLVVGARAENLKPDHVPVRFIRTKSGVAVVAGAPVQPKNEEGARTHVLVLAKHMTNAVLLEMAKSHGLTGLHFALPEKDEHLATPIFNARGRPIAYLHWDSLKPGTKSFETIRPLVWSAAGGLAFFIAGITIAAYVIIRNLARDEAVARHRSNHDPLTDLLNRAGLASSFESRRKTVAPGTEWVLHMIDLDGFKGVNDLWGHPVGDKLIKSVSERILNLTGPDALVARMGGDEFVVIETAKTGEEAGAETSERIREVLCQPFDIDGRIIEIGASIGVVQSGDPGTSVLELVRKADLALYRAKEAGRNAVVRYRDSFDLERAQEAALEGALRKAIDRDEIDVYFQPLVDARTGALRGVEALARWLLNGKLAVSPDTFIPLAERAGLIDALGMQVMRKALVAARQWPNVTLSVNASPVQFKNPYFVEQVRLAVTEADFDPQRLTIEVTEGVMITNPEQAQRAIHGLQQLGIKVALDDFGNGFASIGTLRRFRFDRLKIDRSLVSALGETEEGAEVLQSTISLANALRIPVTAEGIENERQAMVVRTSGCDQLQGYLFSRPVPAEDITRTYFDREDEEVTAASA